MAGALILVTRAWVGHTRRAAVTSGVAAVLVAFPAAAAAAGPAEIRRDFDVDGRLVACAYDASELRAAREAAPAADSDYVEALDRADAADCGPEQLARGRHAFAGVRITRVRAAGDATRESLRLRNLSGRARRIPVRRTSSYRLRMRPGRIETVQFDRAGIVLDPGQTGTIRWTCAPGARLPEQVGATLFFCLDSGSGGLRELDVFADGGAVVSLGDASGLVLSRYGYGSRRSARRF